MTELQKWQTINSAETISQLKSAIILIADEDGMIQGRTRMWSAQGQFEYVDKIINNEVNINMLTRSYGIRRQLGYLIYKEADE